MKAKVYLALVALVVLVACGIDAFAQEAMVRGEVKRIDDGADRVNGQITVTRIEKAK
jgi:major membrane immunogen (membrane-anchored lipoprotein)